MAYDPTKCAWCNRPVPTDTKALQEGPVTKNFCGSTCMKAYQDSKNKPS